MPTAQTLFTKFLSSSTILVYSSFDSNKSVNIHTGVLSTTETEFVGSKSTKVSREV